jgi:hypothetical protein
MIAHQHNDVLSKQDVTYAMQFAEFVGSNIMRSYS